VKRLHCPTCGNEVFFDSLNCIRCLTGLAVDLGGRDEILVSDVDNGVACGNRPVWGCNWLAAPGRGDERGDLRCSSCLLVDDGGWATDRRMIPFQTAQRRALYQLNELGVPWRDAATALRFMYRSKDAGDPALIGHQSGEITLDIDEADPARGEQIRATPGERYRTPLGHIRHELGHYVWLILVASDPEQLTAFRELFGDETADYQAALDRHYAEGPPAGWESRYLTTYATMHPYEDFAETWANYLHICDSVETASEYGLISLDTAAALSDFRRLVADVWVPLSTALNMINRSMGKDDLYPFVLPAPVLDKLDFVASLRTPAGT
jgi:hypothetical protein